MRTDPDIESILHAVGMPASYNADFVSDAVIAVMVWKRWQRARAVQWLKGRAHAAADSGVTVDKWWFVNALYRTDPRVPEPTEEKAFCDPHCRICGGIGWRYVTTAYPDGKTLKTGTTRCDCHAAMKAKRAVSTESRGTEVGSSPLNSAARSLSPRDKTLKELANAKRM